MAQTPQERRRAQRRTARQLQRGERPLGGEYQKYVVSAVRRNAHKHIRTLLGHYLKYWDETVEYNVNRVMSMDQLTWTISADTEEIRSRASNRGYMKLFDGVDRNPWWYHRG
jgi:hypothetical protein